MYALTKREAAMLDLEVIGQGATTKIYRDGSTAIKLYLNAPHDEAENEAVRQKFAHDAGLPVPAVYGVRRLDENTVTLEMEFIDGQPILRQGMDKDERTAAMEALVRLQRDIHKVEAGSLPRQADMIKWKINNTKHLEAAEKSRLAALTDEMSDGESRLCHGDLHPLNILYDGKKYWIIDWVDAAAGSPLADACRTYIIFKQYIGRMAGKYLKIFCKEAGVSQNDVLAWLPVVAAARLNENMDDKTRAFLLDMIVEWRNG